VSATAEFIDTTAEDAPRLDRLRVLTLLASIYFAIYWGNMSPDLPVSTGIAMVALSLAGVLMPGRTVLLALNAAAFVAMYLMLSPQPSNNQLTGFFFSLIFLTAYAKKGGLLGQPAAREALFDAVAGPGRWILAIMYFYGIYHKINADFLDPQVSCAVELYQLLAWRVGLADWGVGHYAAIYATFVFEGIAMLALFMHRIKWIGFAIGIPFHVIIGFTGYQFYMDFSTIVLVLYCLFLPRQGVEDLVARLTERLGGPARAALIGRAVLVFAVGAYATDLALARTVEPSLWSFQPFFAVYAAAFYAFCLFAVPWGGQARQSYPWSWAMVLPLLYLINGFSPYLGLKTESSIAMYSNLHVEAGQTNHLIHGVLPGTATYTDEVLRVVAVERASAEATRAILPGRDLVRYEVDRMLAQDPNLVLVVDGPDGRMRTDAGWQNTYAETPWILRKYLLFKPVDFERPKVCTH